MPVYVDTFFEGKLEQLFDLAELVEKVFSFAGLEYRRVGGVATYLYVEEAQEDGGRQTHLKDMDEVGLITPEIEAGLSPVLQERLALVRAHD